jgi:hypothetical protein
MERNDAPNSQIINRREILQQKGKLVSKCMLEQFYGTTLGVAVGLIFGVRQRNLRPFVVAITLGTFGDYIYGYNTGCKSYIDDYLLMEAEIKSDEHKSKTS